MGTHTPGIVQRLSVAVIVSGMGHAAAMAAIPWDRGDFNGDGQLNADDANMLTAEIAASGHDVRFDLNGDAVVDPGDLDEWLQLYSLASHVPLATARVDVNFDTVNTAADHQVIETHLFLATTDFTRGNLNADHRVDTQDRDLYFTWGGVLMPLVLGDANNDGQVTGADLISVQQHFGQTGAAHGMLSGDANDDGRVTGADLIAVQQNFGRALQPDPLSIPEPVLGFLVVLAGAFRSGRRP